MSESPALPHTVFLTTLLQRLQALQIELAEQKTEAARLAVEADGFREVVAVSEEAEGATAEFVRQMQAQVRGLPA